jgi:hypothetical protein
MMREMEKTSKGKGGRKSFVKWREEKERRERN